MADKQKLLFVDDEKKVRQLLTDTFGNDYDVYLASNGIEALKLKEENRIKLIYTDIQMPKMGGIELCRKIREKDSVSIVCAMTAYTKLFELQECREAGFDDYLKKPIDLKHFSNSINESKLKLLRWFNK